MSSRQHLSSFFVYILLVWQHLCCTSTPDQTLSCFFIYLAPQFITPPQFPQRPHSLLLEEKQGENPPNCVSPPYFDTIVLDPTSDCPVLCHLDLLEFASRGLYRYVHICRRSSCCSIARGTWYVVIPPITQLFRVRFRQEGYPVIRKNRTEYGN